MSALSDEIEGVYETLEGDEECQQYHHRHGTESMLVLTQYRRERAALIAESIREQIAGKRVVEIGAGVGILAIELARYAKSVVAIDVDPAWSWIFTTYLYREKPPNLTWVFGTAESIAEWLRADVAVVVTHSGKQAMYGIAEKIAPVVLKPIELD